MTYLAFEPLGRRWKARRKASSQSAGLMSELAGHLLDVTGPLSASLGHRA